MASLGHPLKLRTEHLKLKTRYFWMVFLDVMGLAHTFCMFLIYKCIILCVHYTKGINPIPLFFLLYFHMVSRAMVNSLTSW